MPGETFEKAREIFSRHNGILRASQANKLGLHGMVLTRMVDEGLLVKEGRGIYRLADLPPLSNPDFVRVSLSIPTSVICLISALNFHNLTTQIPYKVYIALPRSAKKPQIDYPPLDIIWPKEEIYLAGIEEHRMDGVPVKVYSKEKTIADCFRYNKKVGLSVAIEALKDYLGEQNKDLGMLFTYARIDHVEEIITPYVKAIV